MGYFEVVALLLTANPSEGKDPETRAVIRYLKCCLGFVHCPMLLGKQKVHMLSCSGDWANSSARTPYLFVDSANGCVLYRRAETVTARKT